MATPRFYCSTPLAAHSVIPLPTELAHHAIRVLRLKSDSQIVLFDGLGGEYPARLVIEGKNGSAITEAHLPVEAELTGQITLVQGIASGDKMDWIIEKATELGASKVVPIAARRSVLQLSGERLQKRLLHWRRIAQAASEQCGRNRIMEVSEPCSLQAWLESPVAADHVRLLCHPESSLTLAQALDAKQPDTLSVLVGPEGGWAEEEIALANQYALTQVQFGPRVLRTETAGLALISAISALRAWN
ncbi:MAG: 16S rRNA (uracil(1498)-N(3))-methyltransferase [Burkholderiaceae bacterium]|nr:16S rRNA (uracil(1498)-N(3))-methyltransferase [Burkholderiaceae bacterium]